MGTVIAYLVTALIIIAAGGILFRNFKNNAKGKCSGCGSDCSCCKPKK